MKTTNRFKHFVISISWLWLLAFALAPILLVFSVSFLSHSSEQFFDVPWTLKNYRALIDPIYLRIFLRSFFLALLCTLITLAISYPFAYIISRAKSQHKSFLLLLVIIPFWTSSLIRTYAIMAILKAKGLLNTLLLTLGIIHQPLQLLYTNTALLVGLIYTLIPFMILPLYSNMEKLDYALIEAARDLGANKKTVFFRVLLPQTKPGILSGSMLVFLPAMTLFYIPTLLGGAKSMLLGNLIQNQFLSAINWPLGSAISVALILIMITMSLFYWRNTKNADRRELV